MSMRLSVVALSALLSLTACKESGDRPRGVSGQSARVTGGEGVLIEGGASDDLRLAPGGKHVTWLKNGEKPKLDGISPQLRIGTLYAAPVDGGAVQKLGEGVTNTPGGWLVSPDGTWVMFLTGYTLTDRSGSLHVAKLGSDEAPKKLGEGVSYMVASADGSQLAFVEGGTLKVGPLPEGPFRAVGGEVATADFTPDGAHVLYRRRLTAAGGLMVASTREATEPKKLGELVGQYKVSPDGAHIAFTVRSPATRDVYDLHVASFPALAPRMVAAGTTEFAYSPDSKWLARLEGFEPGVKPDLVVGPASGAPGRKLGVEVEQFTFAPKSDAIGMLVKYSDAARAGTLAYATLPDGEPKPLGARVPNFEWSGDGRTLAFIQRYLDPIYSVDLMVYPLGSEAPVKVGKGVFGYSFTPDDDDLLFRTGCIREGRSCNLMRVSARTPDAPAKLVADGIYSYRVSDDGERVMVTFARTESETYDVAIRKLDGTGHRTIHTGARLPAYLVGPDGGRTVFAVGWGKQGVYTATTAPAQAKQ